MPETNLPQPLSDAKIVLRLMLEAEYNRQSRRAALYPEMFKMMTELYFFGYETLSEHTINRYKMLIAKCEEKSP